MKSLFVFCVFLFISFCGKKEDNSYNWSLIVFFSLVKCQEIEFLSPNERLFINGVPIDPKGGQSGDPTVFLVKGEKSSEKNSIQRKEPDLKKVPKEKKAEEGKGFASNSLLAAFKRFGKEKKKETEVKPIVDKMEKELKEMEKQNQKNGTTTSTSTEQGSSEGGEGSSSEASSSSESSESSSTSSSSEATKATPSA